MPVRHLLDQRCVSSNQAMPVLRLASNGLVVHRVPPLMAAPGSGAGALELPHESTRCGAGRGASPASRPGLRRHADCSLRRPADDSRQTDATSYESGRGFRSPCELHRHCVQDLPAALTLGVDQRRRRLWQGIDPALPSRPRGLPWPADAPRPDSTDAAEPAGRIPESYGGVDDGDSCGTMCALHPSI